MMRNMSRRPCLSTHFIALLCLTIGLLPNTHAATGDQVLDGWVQSAQEAASFIARMQKADGLFNYEFDFIPARFSADDHIVRQAGAAYGLGEFLLYSHDTRYTKTLHKALEAFAGLSIKTQSGRLISPDGRERHAKSGATALALLAELQYQQATGDNRYQALREQWLNGLLDQYLPDAGFRETPVSDEESPYFNGEIWLALASYDQWQPANSRLKEILPKVDGYLIASNSAEPDTAFFHWGAMAAARRYQASGDEKFARFAVQQGNSFLTTLKPRMRPGANTCYSVEGLLAVQQVVAAGGADGDFIQRLQQRVQAEMIKNQEFQIRPDQERIYFGKQRFLQLADLSHFTGGYLNGRYRPSARIDFTQHCLSATIKYIQHRGKAR